MRGAADRLLIAACALTFLLPGLGDTPLLDRDGSRFAEAARDMRAPIEVLVARVEPPPD